MLDNITKDHLFTTIVFCGLYDTIVSYGRVAVIDDPEVEKLWDHLVLAAGELNQRIDEWYHKKEYLNG